MAEAATRATILIVDDDDTNRLLLQAQLSLHGFKNLLTASDGRQALDLVERQDIDLIILDIMMPDIDGYAVTRQIRSQYPQRFIPIILVSALHKAHDRIAGIEAGANDFLSRPFDTGELIARVNSWLALKQARDELEAERKRLALLYKVSQALATRLDFQQLMQEIVFLTVDLTGAAKAMLVALDDQGAFQQKILVRSGESARAVDTIDPVVLKHGLLGWVIQNQRDAIVPDVSCDERWVQLPTEDEPTGSAVVAPLITGGKTAGALLLLSPEKGAFGSEHRDVLVAIANQAAVALQNARLYEETRRQQARVEALLNQTGDPVIVTNAVGEITRINSAAENILRLNPQQVLGCPLAHVFGEAVADLLVRAEERNSAVSGEYTLRQGNTEQWLSFNISVSPIEEVGYLLIWQNITPLKEGERIRLASERANTQRLLSIFSRYMSPALVERVLDDPGILTRYERREAIVMFADLRGFTRLTIEHHPNTVLALLNDVFADMIEIVYAHDGVVFEIVGDELMIAFNVPYDQPDAPLRALDTAISMQRHFAKLKAKWSSRGAKVGMGIGINRGQVMLGHVGGRSRATYAMVGEAVNIAHRLVDLASDAQIIVTPEVLTDGLPQAEGVIMHRLSPVTIKGVDRPLEVVVLKVMDLGDPSPAEQAAKTQ